MAGRINWHNENNGSGYNTNENYSHVKTSTRHRREIAHQLEKERNVPLFALRNMGSLNLKNRPRQATGPRRKNRSYKPTANAERKIKAAQKEFQHAPEARRLFEEIASNKVKVTPTSKVSAIPNEVFNRMRSYLYNPNLNPTEQALRNKRIYNQQLRSAINSYTFPQHPAKNRQSYGGAKKVKKIGKKKVKKTVKK
jgi:hypothetical protein